MFAVAKVFNRDYGANRVGPVYDRWDRASQAVITHAQYISRHLECPRAPGPAVVEGAFHLGPVYWIVHYAIDGVQLMDYWR